MKMVGRRLHHETSIRRWLRCRTAPHPKLSKQPEVHMENVAGTEAVEEMLAECIDARQGLAVELGGARCEPSLG